MTDFFPRAGPPAYRPAGPSPPSRASLSALRGRLREGLIEAAGSAASGAVRRLACRLLGAAEGGFTHPQGFHGAGWGDGRDPDDWRDPWARRDDGWDDDEDARCAEQAEHGGGRWRRAAAALCQALAWLLRTLSPRTALGSLTACALAALALLLGGGRIACEAGMALAEAAWDLIEILAEPPARPDE